MNIKEGDKVHIELPVTNAYWDGSVLTKNPLTGDFTRFFKEQIVKHIPKPVEFNIDDEVNIRGFYDIAYTVLGVHKDVLFVQDKISQNYYILTKKSCELVKKEIK